MIELALIVLVCVTLLCLLIPGKYLPEKKPRPSRHRRFQRNHEGGLPWTGVKKHMRKVKCHDDKDTDDIGFFPPEPMTPGDSEVEKVVKAHSDCTAEIFEIMAFGRTRVERTMYSMTPGDRVELRRHDGVIKVYGFYHGTDLTFYINDLLMIPATSLLPKLFDEDITFEAYLGGRDVYSSSKDMAFLSIIVFYHIEGISPTKVNLHF